MKIRLVFLLFVTFNPVYGGETGTQTTLYKSVTPNGQVVYSDRKSTGDSTAKTLKFENMAASPVSPATLAFLEQLKVSGAAAQTISTSSELTLFTTSWCGVCKRAKAYLASKGASYREIDIETKGGAVAYAQAGGQRGVPFLSKDGRHVLGFYAGAYDSMLAGKN